MYPEKSNTDDEWSCEGEVNGSRSEKFLCERNLNKRLIDRKSELRDSQSTTKEGAGWGDVLVICSTVGECTLHKVTIPDVLNCFLKIVFKEGCSV